MDLDIFASCMALSLLPLPVKTAPGNTLCETVECPLLRWSFFASFWEISHLTGTGIIPLIQITHIKILEIPQGQICYQRDGPGSIPIGTPYPV